MAETNATEYLGLSWETFMKCVNSTCPIFKISSLYNKQLRGLYDFIIGEDVFVNMPTGYGKSLMYQMAPVVHSWMHPQASHSIPLPPISVLLAVSDSFTQGFYRK